MLPFIVALPTATVLNVNTTSPEILAAAFPDISTDALAALVAERARKPFATLSDLRSRIPSGVNVPDETALGTSSSFFSSASARARARRARRRARCSAATAANGRSWSGRRSNGSRRRALPAGGRVNYAGPNAPFDADVHTTCPARCPAAPGRADPWALFDDTIPSCSPAPVRRTPGPPRNARRRFWRRLRAHRGVAAAAAAAGSRPGRSCICARGSTGRPRRRTARRRIAQRAHGTVEAIVASRSLVADLVPQFDRILAEPALAPRPSPRHWRWYASGTVGRFVRRPDGSTFATGEHDGVSPELMLALDHVASHEGAPLCVEAAFVPDERTQADFGRRAGTSLVPVAAWRWDRSERAAYAQATDLRQGEFAPSVSTTANGAARLFRWTAALAAVAIVVHVLATIGEWTTLRLEGWRVRSALATLANDLGVSGADDPAGAIARRHADARHRAGLAAPADALPLLARAAPALAALPNGALKSATYGEGHWTFEFAKMDADAAGRLELQLAGAGLATVQAANAAGARMRVSLAPGVL